LSDISIDRMYQIIGQLIVDALPEKWQHAAAYAEIEEDDNGLIYGRYLPIGVVAKECSFSAADELYFLFDEIRHRMHKPGHAPWVKARFTLYPDGHFDLDFTYPDETTR